MKTEQIFRSELIGSEIEIVGAKNNLLLGKKGRVIDETKNTIILSDSTLLKDQIIISLDFQGEKIIIDGKLLIGRSEERLKK